MGFDSTGVNGTMDDNCIPCGDKIKENERFVLEVTYWVDPVTRHRVELATGKRAHLECAQAEHEGRDPRVARNQTKLPVE